MYAAATSRPGLGVLRPRSASSARNAMRAYMSLAVMVASACSAAGTGAATGLTRVAGPAQAERVRPKRSNAPVRLVLMNTPCGQPGGKIGRVNGRDQSKAGGVNCRVSGQYLRSRDA